MEKSFIISCFVTFLIPDAISQCLNRQPQNVLFNRQIPEAIIEAPFAFQQTLIETPNLLPGATTIITDCTPAVCQNLVNTLQLMIVCNLLKNTKGGSELAAQLASPIIGEALSCGCPDRRLINTLPLGLNLPNLYPGLLAPNVIPGPSLCPGAGVANINNNALIGNILSMLGN